MQIGINCADDRNVCLRFEPNILSHYPMCFSVPVCIWQGHYNELKSNVKILLVSLSDFQCMEWKDRFYGLTMAYYMHTTTQPRMGYNKWYVVRETNRTVEMDKACAVIKWLAVWE